MERFYSVMLKSSLDKLLAIAYLIFLLDLCCKHSSFVLAIVAVDEKT